MGKHKCYRYKIKLNKGFKFVAFVSYYLGNVSIHGLTTK